MSQSKQVKAELRGFGWDGTRGIVIRQKVVEGPSALLDRVVTLRLSFEEINDLREHMAEAVKHLEWSDAKLDAVNARNA